MANAALHRARERRAARRAEDAAEVVRRLLDYPFPTGFCISLSDGEQRYFHPVAAQAFFKDLLLMALEGLARRGDVPEALPQSFEITGSANDG